MWHADFIPGFSSSEAPVAEAQQFAFIDEFLLLTTDNTLPEAARLVEFGLPKASLCFGTFGAQPCHTHWWPLREELPDGLKAVSLRDVFSLVPAGIWGIAARARQMLRWDLATRFCGACGTPTQALDGEPAKQCPACGQRDYPRITPAVMALVRRGDELLLARSPGFRPGMYSALAGFVEAGETVEDCLHREVFEEVGVRITNLRWFSSQPWPFPYSLMLAFHADYVSGEIRPQPGEIEDAGWYSLDRLPDLPAPVSIASRLIQDGIAEIQRARGIATEPLRFDSRNNEL